MSTHAKHLLRDGMLVLASIVFAVWLGVTGTIEILLAALHTTAFGQSFVAGLFFTSVFTTAPATVALGTIAVHIHPVQNALVGALGSLVGDLIIFKFVQNDITKDFVFLMKMLKKEKRSLWLHLHFFRLRAFKWIVPLLGALVIASPLPDELGLMMLGLSRVKTRYMIPLTYSMNVLGILLIGLVARQW